MSNRLMFFFHALKDCCSSDLLEGFRKESLACYGLKLSFDILLC